MYGDSRENSFEILVVVIISSPAPPSVVCIYMCGMYVVCIYICMHHQSVKVMQAFSSQDSFAEYCLFYRALLQKRPIILKEPTSRRHHIEIL